MLCFRSSVGNLEQKHEQLICSVVNIYVRMVSFNTKSTLLFSFAIAYFLASRIVFEFGLNFLIVRALSCRIEDRIATFDI